MNKVDRSCLGDGVLLRALDQELTPDQAWAAKLHLDHCEGCRARLEEMRRVSAEIGEMHQVSVPAENIRAFAARLEREGGERKPRLFRPSLRRQLAWCGALALVIFLGLEWRGSGPRGSVARITNSGPMVPAPAVIRQALADPTPAKRVRRARRLAKQPQPAAVAAKEVVTPFFPLPFSDAALPLDQASVIRVDLPRSALELTGVPVEEDRRNERIRADLVVGADGLARAIRFIR